MKTLNRMFVTGLSVAVLFTTLSSNAWSQIAVGPGSGGFSGEFRRTIIIGGRVICAQCTIRDVQATQPELTNLYELHHPQEGRIVMQIKPHEDTAAYYAWWHNDGAIWWKTVVAPATSVFVRGPNSLFRQLIAEENLMKQVQLTGQLSSDRTYDMVSVHYFEATPSPLPAAREAQAAAE